MVTIKGFSSYGSLDTWTTLGLAFHLNARMNTDEWYGAIEWREKAWKMAQDASYDDFRKLMDRYYEASDECAAVEQELDYRRFGELLPSGD